MEGTSKKPVLSRRERAGKHRERGQIYLRLVGLSAPSSLSLVNDAGSITDEAAFVEDKISGLLEGEVFAGHGTSESVKVISDALGNLAAEAVQGSASGVIKNSTRYMSATKNIPTRLRPSFIHGQSDGGPGIWAERYTPQNGASYQAKVTGAPQHTEYVVKTNLMSSGEKNSMVIALIGVY